MTVAVRYLVSGRVQDVGFRSFVQEAALAGDLVGTVRNLPDGRVEAVVEGSSQSVDRFAELLRQGPALAKVTRLNAEPLSTPTGHTRFVVTE